MQGQFKNAIEKIKSGEQTIHLMSVYSFNFQLGRLNLLLGSPGAGKSLMTMHVILKAIREKEEYCCYLLRCQSINIQFES